MGRVEDAMRRARQVESLSGPQSQLPMPDAFSEEPGDPVEVFTRTEPVPNVEPRPIGTGGETDESAVMVDRLAPSTAGKVVVDRNMVPASREQYRRLAATLLHGQATSGLKVVMVTSAAVGEGKSLTASNLALTFSESYQRRVLLIDADLRRPSLHQLFNFSAGVGLSEALMLPDDQRLTLHRASSHLSVVPAGAPSNDPMAGLSSDRMRGVIEEAREAFDWVIIDTPPVGLLSDASLLGAMVDGVLLVVKAGATPFERVQRAIDAVGRERVLGVVLNRVAADRSPAYYAYSHYYDASRSAP
jgi:capsular exopolysaccharide synthesis family protein